MAADFSSTIFHSPLYHFRFPGEQKGRSLFGRGSGFCELGLEIDIECGWAST